MVEEKMTMAEELEGKFFALKLDMVTHQRSHYLGITIHYWTEEGDLQVKTLALIDVSARRDGLWLKEVVLEVLHSYQLSGSNILECVVDKAANITVTSSGEEETEAADEELVEQEQLEDVEVEDVQSKFPDIDCSIHHTWSATSAMQKGIEVGIKTGRPAAFIRKCQHVAQKLRAPRTYAILGRRCGDKGAIVINKTQWGTKFLMLERLLELNDMDKKTLAFEEVHLTDGEWDELEHFVQILEIPYKATLALQREGVTPGEFLLEWREVVFHLENVGGDLALGIARALRDQEGKLYDNNIFLAAVWIDSRSRVLLDRHQRDRAKLVLHSVYQRWECSMKKEQNDDVR